MYLQGIWVNVIGSRSRPQLQKVENPYIYSPNVKLRSSIKDRANAMRYACAMGFSGYDRSNDVTAIFVM